MDGLRKPRGVRGASRLPILGAGGARSTDTTAAQVNLARGYGLLMATEAVAGDEPRAGRIQIVTRVVGLGWLQLSRQRSCHANPYYC